MSIVDERREYKPYEYEQAHQYWLMQQNDHWLHTETISMPASVDDWKYKLTEAEKKIIAGVLLGFTQAEVYIGMYWGTKVTSWFPKPEIREMALCFASTECFDDKTELLTSEGWVPCPQITSEHKIAQYDLHTKEIIFINPLKVVNYDYCGIMHYYKGQSTNICVTPNHDLITIHPTTGKTDKRPSYKSKLGRNYKYPVCGKGVGSNELSSLERVLIAVQADGCLRGLCPSGKDKMWRSVDMKLTKERKITRIEQLLLEAGLEYTKRSKGRESIFHFCLPPEVEISQVKNLRFLDLDGMSSQKAEQAIEEILKWDGNGKDYYSTCKEAIDKVQAIAVLSGIYGTNLGINRTAAQSLGVLLPQGGTPRNTKTCYVLTLTKDLIERTYPHRKEVTYDGKVYCVSVPTQNIISRREGKVAFTGNTIHAVAYNFLSDTLGLEEHDAFLKEPTAAAKLDNIINRKENSLYDIALSLAVYSGFAEGVSLYSSFAILLSFSQRNLLKGVGEIIAWSVVDERIHSYAGCWLYRQLVAEHPYILESDIEERILEAADITLKLEFDFIDMVFDGVEVKGISAAGVKEFMKHRANLKLEELNIKPVYEVDETLQREVSDWFYLSTESENHTDFFAARPTNYTKGSFDPNLVDWAIALS